MTIKHKIIGAFIFMLILLGASAVIGFHSMKTSSEHFNKFNDLARLNAVLHDMDSETYAQAYARERFLKRQGPDHMQQAVNHLKKSADLAQKGIEYASSTGLTPQMKQLHADTVAYIEHLEGMRATGMRWMDAYSKSIEPQLVALQNSASHMGLGMQGGNASIGSMNGLWEQTYRLGNNMSALINAQTPEAVAAAVSVPTADCQKHLSSLRGVLPAEYLKYHTDYSNALGTINAALANNRAAAVELASDVQKAYEFDQKVLKATLDLSNAVSTQMSAYADETENSGASLLKGGIALTVGGIALGAILLFLIIYSLNNVLKRSSAYARAVANGNFDGEPDIKEKGDVGGMVSSIREIPQTLNKVLNQYNSLEQRIERGHLLAHGAPEDFQGGFATLVKGTDNIISRLRTVLENVPSPVVMLDKDLKASYLNHIARQLAGEDYVGKTCYDLFKREDAGPNDGLNRALNTKEAATGETRAHPGGHDMFIRYTAIPMLDENGEIVSVMQLITDLTELKQREETMTKVATEAMEISNNVASAAEELSAQIEKISAGAETQRMRMEQATSAMTEMNSTVIEVARSAGEAAQQSEKSRQNAESGADLVGKAVVSIGEVNAYAGRLQQNMDKLEEQANNIGDVMDVITDIADQTNLLALNAAIEAARAGDAGRGFAVVADEVRKLAEKTVDATHEVGANISGIQKSVKENMLEVESTVKKVDEATEVAGRSGEALSGILELASATSGHVASIATAAEEQSAASEEITNSLEEVNLLVRETSEGMGESSLAIQMLARTAQDLKRLLDDLNMHG